MSNYCRSFNSLSSEAFFDQINLTGSHKDVCEKAFALQMTVFLSHLSVTHI